MKHLEKKFPILKKIKCEKEVVWMNPDKVSFEEGIQNCELSMKDINDAEERLERFAPFIMRCFPETKDRNGIIESVLTDIPAMRTRINQKYGSKLQGRLLLKQDSHLAMEAGNSRFRMQDCMII